MKKISSKQLFVGVIVLFVLITITPYITGNVTYAREKGAICKETDFGRDYATVGEVTDGKITYKDWCEGEKVVIEYSCSKGNEVVKERYPCQNSNICSDGACKEKVTCKDTDTGRFFYTKGTAAIGDESKTDHCTDDAALMEYYCTDMEEIREAPHNCPYGCENGACIHHNLK